MMSTEERRLEAEEGPLTKKTWLQKTFTGLASSFVGPRSVSFFIMTGMVREMKGKGLPISLSQPSFRFSVFFKFLEERLEAEDWCILRTHPSSNLLVPSSYLLILDYYSR